MTDVADLRVGDERVVDVGPVAHGGHCIAHTDGRTLFVRHALPGERVRVRVTDVNRQIVRADAIEILDGVGRPGAGAVPVGASRGCGGCDFQHVDRCRPAPPEADGADRGAPPVRPPRRRRARRPRPHRARAAGPSRRPALAHPHDAGRRTRPVTSACAVTAATTSSRWTGA